MTGWKQNAITLSSFLICALVVILGTLFYPLILLFFSIVALLVPLYRRLRPSPPAGGRIHQGETGR